MWITSSKEIADVLRGDGRWKHEHRHVHLIGGKRAEAAAEYPASLVVAVLRALKRHMVLDKAVRPEELAFAGPVPDEGDYSVELEGTWGVDGQWIDPKLLKAGREEEIEYMMKHGVFEVVDEKECYAHHQKPLTLKWVDKMKGDVCRSRLVCREIKKAKSKDDQLGPEEVFSPMPPSEGLKMLISAMMTGRDDDNHEDGPIEMATWDVSRAHLYGDARRWIYTYLPEGYEQQGKLARLCRSMYGTQDAASIWGDKWGDLLKEHGLNVGIACPAFFCGHGGSLKGLCHGDDFCVTARRRNLDAFGKILDSKFEVKMTGHIGLSSNVGYDFESYD